MSRRGVHGAERGEYWRLRSRRFGTVRANILTAVLHTYGASYFSIQFLHLRADRCGCIIFYSNLS